MGWEKRGNRYYYYRKLRIGSTVLSQYAGAGTSGHLAAQLDAAEEARRAEERLAWQETLERERAIDAEIGRLDALILSLLGAVLLVSGYHSHKGEWRKLRGTK